MTQARASLIALGLLVAVGAVGLGGAARRNWTYLQLVRGQRVTLVATDATSRPEHLLRLRTALAADDWVTATQELSTSYYSDRLEPMLVIRDAERRVGLGDTSTARRVLSLLSAERPYDAGLWYRVGETFERAQSPDDAARAYERGASRDAAEPWSYGRYRLSLLDQQAQRWPQVVASLAPLFERATDAEIVRPIDPADAGGALWQGCLLALGEAYAHLGDQTRAEAAFARMSQLAQPRPDWTLNRGLTYLAQAQSARGDAPAALRSIVRALDLSTTFEVAYRRRFELDTAAEAARIVDQARATQSLPAVQGAIDSVERETPKSVGVWWMQGMVAEAACDVPRARAAFARAASRAPAGAGAFLEGHPADPSKSPCGRV